MTETIIQILERLALVSSSSSLSRGGGCLGTIVHYLAVVAHEELTRPDVKPEHHEDDCLG